MKKVPFSFFILCLLCASFLASGHAFAEDSAAPQGELKILTFNIRMSFGESGTPSAWKNRKALVTEIMRRGDYDFIGVQEAIITAKPDLNQVEDLKELLPNYNLLTRSRMRSETEGESTPILWRKDRWEIDEKEHGVFWLSDTPTVPESITWENACPRTVVWGKFHELKEGKRTGRCVYFINTHFDHVSEKARQLSCVQIADFIAARADQNAPVFLTGDFNTGEKSRGIAYLLGKKTEIQAEEAQGPIAMTDTFRTANPDAEDVQTFHGYGKVKFNDKIDYILMLGGLRVKSAQILRDKGEIYPSDHYPVDAVMEF